MDVILYSILTSAVISWKNEVISRRSFSSSVDCILSELALDIMKERTLPILPADVEGSFCMISPIRFICLFISFKI